MHIFGELKVRGIFDNFEIFMLLFAFYDFYGVLKVLKDMQCFVDFYMKVLSKNVL